ncbi:hypothetical protein Btru_001789 [Bulinus truncatus]|nr:hypothetical protein Btru_001789 [Bulinus truncatus]
MKGQEFVDAVQRLHLDYEQDIITDKCCDSAVKALVELGCDTKTILQAAEDLHRENGSCVTSDVILDRIEENCNEACQKNQRLDSTNFQSIESVQDDITSIKRTNQELRNLATCKICMDRSIAVVFLPCSHFVSCLDCSMAFGDVHSRSTLGEVVHWRRAAAFTITLENHTILITLGEVAQGIYSLHWEKWLTLGEGILLITLGEVAQGIYSLHWEKWLKASIARNTFGDSLHSKFKLTHNRISKKIKEAASCKMPSQDSNIQTARITVSRSLPGNGPAYTDIAVITQKPARLDMVSFTARLKTFDQWPSTHEIKIEDLASAGFYFAGYNDCARCFACGVGLKFWEPEDDPRVEHAKHFPTCFFIRQAMGQDFIDTVQRLANTNKNITMNMVMEEMSPVGRMFLLEKKIVNRNDPAVKAVVDLGFDSDTVIKLATTLKKESNGTLTSDMLIERLLGETTVENLRMNLLTSPDLLHSKDNILDVVNENTELRQISMCKVCLDEQVAIVFLPCSHFVTCLDCSYALSKCPVCRKHITATVRGYLNQ